MPASDICAAWTFGSIRSDNLEKGMKPMPIEGSAQRAQAMSWWGGASLTTKIVVGLTAATTLILIIVLPIVISIGNSNDDAATSDSPLVFRQLARGLTCPSGQTASYTSFLGATGSTFHMVPSWQGTLYAKDADGAGSGGCVTEFSTGDVNWYPVTQNSSSVPVMPTAITATPTVWQGPEGYYYLRINGCIAYYYGGDTSDAYWTGVSATWPVFKPDGTMATAAPVCA